jgi:DNA-binding CsgD family transcriptional regulator
MSSHAVGGEALSSTIASIYDAALDPAKWQDFVDTVHDQFHGVEPVFYLADTHSAIISKLFVSRDWDDDFPTPCMAYYNALNPWTPGLVSAPSIGQPIPLKEIIPDNEFEKTEFYNDVFKAWDNWMSVIGVVPYRDEDAFSVLGLHCSTRFYGRNKKMLCHLAEQLSSHIARAFEISRKLHHGASLKATLEAMLEKLSSAAIVVGTTLNVLYANRSAKALFRSRALLLDRAGRIAVASGEHETCLLRDVLRAAFDLQREPHSGEPPPLIPLPNPKTSSAPLLAQVIPVSKEPDDSPDRSPFVPPNPNSVLLLITDPTVKPQLAGEVLRTIFGLTPAEARLAIALAEGNDLITYSDNAGITRATARSQLKAIFAKTDTHRQADLTVLLSRLADTQNLAI